jgi:hypothetical protein
MIRYLRFADLKAAGIVNNWPSLKNRIEKFGFPPGRLIGPNSRVWSEPEIADYIASRPTDRKPAPRRRKSPIAPVP